MSEQTAEQTHDEIGIAAAVDALMTDSGLPRYGPHRAVVERRVQLAFKAYVNAIQGHPHSAANILAIIRELAEAQAAARAFAEAGQLVATEARGLVDVQDDTKGKFLIRALVDVIEAADAWDAALATSPDWLAAEKRAAMVRSAPNDEAEHGD